MALGTREGGERSMWVATQDLPRSPGHPFYVKLNEQLDEAGFDRFVEDLCMPYYAKRGRRSIPPGVYFRMLFVGYFEGINSQRGIAWRCSDSLSLREFLLLGLEGKVPDHSSLTVIRQRLPIEVYDEVFVFVLAMMREAGLVDGRTVAVDATALEANAAMKSIVRREPGATRVSRRWLRIAATTRLRRYRCVGRRDCGPTWRRESRTGSGAGRTNLQT